MGFFKGKQGKDLIIIGAVAFIAFKFMGNFKPVVSAPIQKQTI